MTETATNGRSATKDSVNALSKDVARVESNTNELFSKFNALAQSIGRANWQLIISASVAALAFAGGIWGLAVLPINTKLELMREEIRQNREMNSEQYKQLRAQEVGLAEIRRDLAAAAKTIDTFRDLIRRLESESISSRDYAKDETVRQKQIDAIQTKIDSVFPPSKTLEEIATRLRNLETRSWQNVVEQRK